MKHLAFIAALCATPALASDPDAADWFDQAEAEEARLREINTGVLEFHPKAPDRRIHRLYNRLDIGADSLTSGYVDLYQCHASLDPIHRVEIRYRYKHMKGLRLETWQDIERAWVEGDSVQMVNVEEGARLCIRAEIKILQAQAGGGYLLRSGPFHRRFLDGYFPMQVSLDIRYPETLLRLAHLDPQPQPGLGLRQDRDGLRVDALFSGMLTLEFGFHAPPARNTPDHGSD
ncbi:MAG: hypothetical protein LC646_09760 [Xanthomonadaceae bacterium]|nr:hypothetical protein [Xanthomonadaceae bacterium]